MALTRIEGWEARLQRAIAGVLGQPYTLGENDCLAAACASIRALTGVDLWPCYAGAYRNRFGMLRFIVRLAGRYDFAAAFSALCGVAPTGPQWARRGDILHYTDAEGTDCLAVCLGARALVPTAAGWGYVAATACRAAWRIG